jgi:hypothetical protein
MTQFDSNENLEERIRVRAYELYSKRGEGDGHALIDWLQAEEEILRGASSHWAFRHTLEKNATGKK